MDIETLIPHRPPSLWVDRIESIEPGVRCVASKHVAADAPCFSGHFPGHPILPGIFLIEAAAQAAGLMMASTTGSPAPGPALLAAVNFFKFVKPVSPGSTLEIEVRRGGEAGRLVQVSATIRVAGERVASGDLALVAR
jgi:3-hydroxyacyl-[acyl-carrier-protein] dehydratase